MTLVPITHLDAITRRPCGCSPAYITCRRGRELLEAVNVLQDAYFVLLREYARRCGSMDQALQLPVVNQAREILLAARRKLAQHLKLED